MSSSNLERMEIAEPSSVVSTGYFLTKKLLAIIAVVVGIVFVGSILATHFGTKSNYSSAPSIQPTTVAPVTVAPVTDAPVTDPPVTDPPVTDPEKTTTAPVKIDYRLPKHLKPFFYELELQPFVGPKETYGDKAFTFNGTNKMHFTCKNATNKIVFHAMELTLVENGLQLSDSDGNNIGFNSLIDYDSEKQYFTITLNSDLKVDQNYTLTVPYYGVIIDKLVGFYRGSYIENGKTH